MLPIIISVAITGSVPHKKDNPALPVLPSEQIESTQAAYEAGATLVHIHVRNDDGPRPRIPIGSQRFRRACASTAQA
jgi:uncharacterized protein (DUF849 family)